MKKVLIVLLLAILIGVGAIFALNFFEAKESDIMENPFTELSFISEDNIIDKKDFKRLDGQIFLSSDYIKEYLDPNLKYEENEHMLILTNKERVKRLRLNESEGYVNDVKIDLRANLFEEDGKIYVPIEAFIYDYPVDLRYIEDKNLIVMDRLDYDYLKGKVVKENAKLRLESDPSSAYIKSVENGEDLIIYKDADKYYKVRELNGFVGYLKKSEVELDTKRELLDRDEIEIKKDVKKKINLVWDYTYSKLDSTEGVMDLPGVNVVSPTWFSLSSKDGDLNDLGLISYVSQYKSLGKEVWIMFDNAYEANITGEFLKNPIARQKAIKLALQKVISYGANGINVDFEHIAIDDRDNFTQFMRELYPIFKEHDLTVSVDVTPRIYADVTKEPYDRKALADTVDYLILMAYDQHWASSPNAGSVAEHRWVENNLNVLFRSVPMEKFILGVPLYTRLWEEEAGKVKSQSIGMQTAEDFVAKNEIALEWDEKAKQRVGSKLIGNKLYSIWMEDAESLAHKAQLVTKYDLAGIASWRKGFETSDVWLSIKENVNY
ncbi:MAG: glycosyl hydrolase family 18 protein [Tissierellia bacterium]|nr:glycosyl hydrolase family 18 protein [Tissierellia bacterium]